MSLNEQEYDERALPELRALVDALDTLVDDDFDAELSADILAIEFADGEKYIVNSHRAARQIWMAAARSAWHFDWDAKSERWIAAKTEDELWQTVSRVLGEKLGRKITLFRRLGS